MFICIIQKSRRRENNCPIKDVAKAKELFVEPIAYCHVVYIPVSLDNAGRVSDRCKRSSVTRWRDTRARCLTECIWMLQPTIRYVSPSSECCRLDQSSGFSHFLHRTWKECSVCVGRKRSTNILYIAIEGKSLMFDILTFGLAKGEWLLPS